MSGRYHLYVSYGCPFAHRTLLMRKLKGLEEHISISVLSPELRENGWAFGGYEGATEDHVNGKRYLHELYTTSD